MSIDQAAPDDASAPIAESMPSAYDDMVAASGGSGAGAATAQPPGPYDTVVNFDESEVEPIIGRVPPYTSVVFDESEVEPIVGRPPTPYTSVTFDDTEVEPIVGRYPASPYDRDIASGQQDTGKVLAPAAPSNYRQVVAPETATLEPNIGRRPASYRNLIPSRAVTFSAAEGAVIKGRPTSAPSRNVSFSDAEALRIAGVRPVHVPASFFQRLPLRASGHISFELSDAWDLPRPTNSPPGLTPAKLQVMSWLQAYQHVIVDAESRRHVDRRAIAAAIAWEALKNPWPLSMRGVGPGKVHFRTSVVREVEAAGYLPVRSDMQRWDVLQTPAGAIEYIAAIMQAQSDIAASFGWDTRRNVPILANEYQGRDLTQWRAHLAEKTRGAPLEAANSMALWAAKNLPYLEAAVGTPDPSAFGPP